MPSEPDSYAQDLDTNDMVTHINIEPDTRFWNTGFGIYVGASTTDGGPIATNFIIGFTAGVTPGTSDFNVQLIYYRGNTTNVPNTGMDNTVGRRL